MLDIQKNVPLAPYTTFKIGGPAKFFVAAKNEEEIIEALKYARENNLNHFILGGGSNLLVSDKGFDGLVVRIQNSKFKIQNSILECGAGINLAEVVKQLVKKGLTGLEWATGIPGTIGGAVLGNAGAFGGEMGDNVEKVRVFNLGKIKIENYRLSDCQFDYRNSIFKQSKNLIILSMVLKLQKGDQEKIHQKIKEILSKRKQKQPNYPSTGSFFKNPIVKNKGLIARFESEAGIKIKDSKLPAGWLIEKAGLKGKKIGRAQVSEKNGNFIINTGKATAEDVIILISIIKQKIRSHFGVQLEEEARYVGF